MNHGCTERADRLHSRRHNGAGKTDPRGAMTRYRPSICFLFAAILVLFSHSAVDAAKFRALVAGVTEYEGLLVSDPPLRLDVAAREMASALRSLAERRNFEDKDIEIVLLTDTSKSQGPPTRKNIIEKFQELAATSHEDDIVAFFFTGHGTSDYLYTTGAHRQNLATQLELSTIRKILEGSRAKTTFIFIDACQVLNASSHLAAQSTLDPSDATLKSRKGGLVWLFSADRSQVAYVDRSKRYGVFSDHLITALGSDAADGWVSGSDRAGTKDGVLEISELNAYLHDKVFATAREQYGETALQRPIPHGNTSLLLYGTRKQLKPPVKPQVPAPLELKLGSPYPRNFPGQGTLTQTIVGSLNDRSRGALQLTYYAAGEYASARDLLEAVSRGEIDGGVSEANHWAERDPAFHLLTDSPFGPQADERADWRDREDVRQTSDRLWAAYNQIAFPCGVSMPLNDFWTLGRSDSAALEAFFDDAELAAHLKQYRLYGTGLAGEVLQRAGVTVLSQTPAAAIRSMLLLEAGDPFKKNARTVFYGAVNASPNVHSMEMDQVISYEHSGALSNGSIWELHINLDKWNGMQPHHRELLLRFCTVLVSETGRESRRQRRYELSELRDLGVQSPEGSPIGREALWRHWAGLVAEYSEQSAAFKQLYETLPALNPLQLE